MPGSENILKVEAPPLRPPTKTIPPKIPGGGPDMLPKGMPGQPDTQPAKKTKPEKPGLSAGKKWAIGLTATVIGATGIGYGVGVADAVNNHEIPLPGAMAHPYGWFENAELVSTIFDPTALEQTVTAANSVQMTWEEYEKIATPTWIENGETFTMLLPIRFGSNRIPTLHLEKGVDYGNSGRGFNLISIRDGLKAGDKFFSPFDGKLKIAKPGGKYNFFYLYSTAEGHGMEDAIIFLGTGMELLPGMKQTGEDRDYIYFDVEENQDFGKLLSSDKHDITGVQLQIQGIGRTGKQKNFNLQTNEGKLVVLQ
jgi:hypothetical protein